jgi:penicillin-insensitive murein endopeptidase
MNWGGTMGLAKRLGFLLVLAWSLTPSVVFPSTWGEILDPAPGTPRVIGSYTAGCVQGAVPLPAEGQGYQVMRPQRRRYYGHPVLVGYLQELGTAANQKGLGMLLIGDLGQPRGGPMPSGHRSHQSGLDVDIWFWLPNDGIALSVADRETIGAPSMLSMGRMTLDVQQWSPRQAEVLRLAVGFDVVARIFVNPVIKKAMCSQFRGATWLQKLRPWWGHDDHFHVRLRCPAGQTACQEQEPLPAGDGCGAELDWWFTAEARKAPPPADLTKVPLPAACEAILRQAR